jgi:hypothetical protein
MAKDMKSKIDENETQKGMRHLLCIYTHHTKEYVTLAPLAIARK